jgi:hypothetical protein
LVIEQNLVLLVFRNIRPREQFLRGVLPAFAEGPSPISAISSVISGSSILPQIKLLPDLKYGLPTSAAPR